MRLSRQQRKNLKDALIDAFPTSASLEQMLSYQLDKSLKVIAGEGSLQDIVFRLIQVAESQGWIEDLIRAAREWNPLNQNLQTIAQEVLTEFVVIHYSRNLYRIIKKILTHPFVSNLASKNFLITNILMAILLIYTGFSMHTLWEIKTNAFILEKKAVCSKFINSGDNEVLNNVEKLNIDNSPNLNNEYFLAFYCKKTLNQEDKNTDSKDIYLSIQPILSDLITKVSIDKKNITIQDMENLCNEPKYYDDKLKKTLKENNIKTTELTLSNSQSEWKNVIPAYRWKCVYTLAPKSESKKPLNQEDNEGDNDIIGGIVTIKNGLNLDKFICEEKYPSEGLTKSTFLEYRNPYSWYCVQTKESKK